MQKWKTSIKSLTSYNIFQWLTYIRLFVWLCTLLILAYFLSKIVWCINWDMYAFETLLKETHVSWMRLGFHLFFLMLQLVESDFAIVLFWLSSPAEQIASYFCIASVINKRKKATLFCACAVGWPDMRLIAFKRHNATLGLHYKSSFGPRSNLNLRPCFIL